MTEAEWETASVYEMLLDQRRHLSARQLRLFACACVRRALPLLNDPASERVVAGAERFADGLATRRDLAAFRAAAPGRGSGGISDLIAKAAANCAAPSAQMAVMISTVALATASAQQPRLVGLEVQAELFREIVGSPRRRVAVPPDLPAMIKQLAQALYDGDDCAYALHDALLDAGHTELAAHFERRNHPHPKGCWAVDLILGRE